MKEKLFKIVKAFSIYCLILLTLAFISSIFMFGYPFNISAYKTEHKGFVNNIRKNITYAENELFKNYKPQINIQKYPKTFSEYLKIEKSDKLLYSYAKLNQRQERALIKELEPHKGKKHFIIPGIRKFDKYDNSLYYDESGNLLYIETMNDIGKKIYRYNKTGTLAEAEYSADIRDNELTYIFDQNKEIKYICGLDTYFSKNNYCQTPYEIFDLKQSLLNIIRNATFWAWIIFLVLLAYTSPIFGVISIFWLILTSKMQKKQKIICSSAFFTLVLSIVWIIYYLSNFSPA